MLLAGLYHYVAGSILEEHPLFHPLFLLAPKTEKDKGYQYLLSCTEDQNPLISNEARYFLMKVNNQINKEYFEVKITDTLDLTTTEIDFYDGQGFNDSAYTQNNIDFFNFWKRINFEILLKIRYYFGR